MTLRSLTWTRLVSTSSCTPSAMEGVLLVFAAVFEWQNGNALHRNVRRRRVVRQGSIVPPGEQRKGHSGDADQTGRKSQSARRFPAIKDLGARQFCNCNESARISGRAAGSRASI